MTISSRLALALMLAALWLSAPRPAAASLLWPLDTAALVSRADRILVGTVEQKSSRWQDDTRSTIITEVRIRVTRALRGVKEGDVVLVRHLGGTVDGIGMRVYGEAAYSPGEEVLLFAQRRGDAFYAVGMSQGKLHVATEGGRKIVQQNLAGAELIQTPAKVPAGPRPLDDLLREVNGYIHAQPAVRK